MTVLLILYLLFLNCSMTRYNGRLHCIVGVLPTCYKRKAATYFYPPGGTRHLLVGIHAPLCGLICEDVPVVACVSSLQPRCQ